jgi:hypothetical protein
MTKAGWEILGGEARRLLQILFFLVEHCIGIVVLVLLGVFILIILLGDDVDLHRVGLHDFELGLAFRAAQNLAFFHFVFVDIDFDCALGAANQCRNLLAMGWLSLRASVLYIGVG